jgi:hypothetical protein
MTYLKLEEFSGVVPKLGPTSLDATQAQIARNVKLQSGELRSWGTPTLAFTPATNNTKTIFKFEGAAGTTPIWLEWTDDVDIVLGPVADTGEYRLYFSSTSFSPRKTNWLMANNSGVGTPPFPSAWFELGVPTPTSAPIALAAGTGTAPIETRAYVYTHVTEFGLVAEESAPSPAVIVNANYSGDAVTISGFATPPTGNYNFKYRRIYRTVSGNASSGYQLVAEIPIANSSYVDTKAAINLGKVLDTFYYTPPPSGLHGLVTLPNGIVAGFTGNEIWFCEPYMPHAWPQKYMLTTDYPIVGLGVFGNSLFVGTTKNPYIVSGSDPNSMSQNKLPMLQPCVSKRSITSDQFGVLYASANGIVAINLGYQDVVTTQFYSRDEWQALNPSSMIGILYNNMYFGFYNVGGVYDALVLTRNDKPPLANFDFPARAVFIEATTGALSAVSAVDNKVYTIDADKSQSVLYKWRSKKFIMPAALNFAAMQVFADYTYMAAVGGRYINIKVYADDALVFNSNILNQNIVRMAAGFRANNWEVEITGNVPVRGVTLATSVAELKAI